MTRNQKLVFMFLPLTVAFVLVSFLMDDVKHPVVEREGCVVISTGPGAARLLKQNNLLYSQGDNVLDDIALQCAGRGVVVINDHQPFGRPIEEGSPANLTRKQYRYFPTQWRLDILTGEPTVP